jgi:hypothetical protein
MEMNFHNCFGLGIILLGGLEPPVIQKILSIISMSATVTCSLGFHKSGIPFRYLKKTIAMLSKLSVYPAGFPKCSEFWLSIKLARQKLQ